MAKGWSQERLANEADVEVMQVSRIERGIINTTISQSFNLAKALQGKEYEVFLFYGNSE